MLVGKNKKWVLIDFKQKYSRVGCESIGKFLLGYCIKSTVQKPEITFFLFFFLIILQKVTSKLSVVETTFI